MSEHFTPPAQDVEITQVASYPDGRVSSLTAELVDAEGKRYSIVLATAGKIAADASADAHSESLQLLDDDRERVFVVPGTRIEPDEIEAILAGVSPELLDQYLTPQV